MATTLPTLPTTPAVARRMADAARAFLGALTPEQLAVARFPFEGDERYVWHYTPIERNGLQLKQMNPSQRDMAFKLLESGLSSRGTRQTREIMAIESVLKEIERLAGDTQYQRRDPDRYSFSIFGEPGSGQPWAWRVGGHHIGIHFTVVAGDLIASTPLFFGSNPAEVRHGPTAGSRILAEEEDMARALVSGLPAAQQQMAIVDPFAPSDILTKNYRLVDPSMPLSGIPYAALTGEHRGQLVALIRHYLDRTTDDLATNAWKRIEQTGLDGATFAWAGPIERGAGHYYAIKGPAFMIEYDNTQNGANHVHAVWRDFAGDWGEDLLAAHYASSDHHH